MVDGYWSMDWLRPIVVSNASFFVKRLWKGDAILSLSAGKVVNYELSVWTIECLPFSCGSHAHIPPPETRTQTLKINEKIVVLIE
jgi:hypothetical protein